MIVLLNCSINLFANNTDVNNFNPSTGDVVNRDDSVLISYNDLRIVNSKLTELKYEKEINIKLHEVISNDSIALHNYKIVTDKIQQDYKKAIKQRNIAIGSTAVFILTTILTLLLK